MDASPILIRWANLHSICMKVTVPEMGFLPGDGEGRPEQMAVFCMTLIRGIPLLRQMFTALRQADIPRTDLFYDRWKRRTFSCEFARYEQAPDCNDTPSWCSKRDWSKNCRRKQSDKGAFRRIKGNHWQSMRNQRLNADGAVIKIY